MRLNRLLFESRVLFRCPLALLFEGMIRPPDMMIYSYDRTLWNSSSCEEIGLILEQNHFKKLTDVCPEGHCFVTIFRFGENGIL